MAIYHLHVQVIGRSASRSVTAAAAYRSASRIESEYTGETFDYTKKQWVEYSVVLLPPNAPPEYHDRQVLWNSADAAEKGRNAQLARELDVALPVELTLDQQIALVRDFVQDTFIKVCIDQNIQKLVYALHSKAYWVVCIDSGMDGALLRNDEEHKDDYSIIGFSTGKGVYGQYNLTITARRCILVSIKKRLSARLHKLFKWDEEKVQKAAVLCINEAGKLDEISLFSAINPKDHNVNEFMAYVLTSLREKKNDTDCALKIMIHLDSYKHWFSNDMEKDVIVSLVP